jgi:hypothetical protein
MTRHRATTRVGLGLVIAVLVFSLGVFMLDAGDVGARPVASSASTCRPPRGPFDHVVHTGGVHVQRVTCTKAREVILTCYRFSYGASGTCSAADRRWHCTSRKIGGSESTERCIAAGDRRVRWVWLD